MAIRVLPPQVAAQIAAGEVVERPASVVKELLENALDAGARSIAVTISQGGLALIRVTDDGEGVAADELEAAFARHATSKLSSAEDLERIATLGFRGEALPSIAAVAQVTLHSRPPGVLAAAFLRLEEGVIAARGQRGAPVGTTVEVRKLFARQPVRRHFLRSAAAEGRQIVTLVAHYALAYPQVRFSLVLDGRRALQSDGRGSRRDVAAAVYGPQVAAALLELREEGAGEGRRPGWAGHQGMALEGLLSPPSIHRASRGYVSIFINGRWVRSRPLTYAIQEAYADLLPSGRYPIAVIDLRLPPEEVDVNVHPAKAEVRLRREREVFAFLQRSVRHSLLAQAPVVPFAAPPAARVAMPAPELPMPGEPSREGAALGPAKAPASPAASHPVGAHLDAPLLPILRVVGQMGDTYIVAEGPDGLYLLDQHAAHERVLYERLSARRGEERPEVQGLLEPLAVELSPRQEQALLDYSSALSEEGFQVEPFGPRTYLVRAVPSLLAGRDLRQALMDLLDGLEGETGDRRNRLAMTLACHGAIRAGQVLALEEMRQLLRQLEGAQNPHTCPHGRPTLLHMSRDRLDREFRRR